MAETLMVPGGGIEPPFSAPKTAVLPLDDPGSNRPQATGRNDRGNCLIAG
jgi:hypothetical protein